MALHRNIGKNTIGDNNKMGISMHDYEMSTQNLSYIFRSTMGVGTLTPFMKIPCQKGDVLDINLMNKTMTHPTLGPLFGAYKLQHFVFFAGTRLYNSWLHNNRTGIGMKIKDIKFPLAELPTSLITGKSYGLKTNPSSLYYYLGWKGSVLKDTAAHEVYKNAIPQLIYLDIFKNYFANTQEKNFYMVKSTDFVEYLKVTTNSGMYNYYSGRNQSQPIQKNTLVAITNENTNATTFWANTNFVIAPKLTPDAEEVKSASQMATIVTTKAITLDKTPDNYILKRITWVQVSSPITLGTYPLETLDEIRDEILATKGNTPYFLNTNTQKHSANILAFYKDLIQAQRSKLGGLLLKTYDSDIFQNWIKTEFIEGTGSIAEITAVDVSSGKLSMDALNLQQKVYNYLNRIAISGGTYRDYLETTYTAGKYIDRSETPIFIGGISQMIEFDEVVSQAATDTPYGQQPLGDLAGRGYARKPSNSGHIHYQCDEPGYIIGITAITPMIDYSQGNDFDLNWETMDDIHKPALDGIGYQDSMNEQRAWWTAAYTGYYPSNIQDTSAGKTIAWIDYMTNFNKIFGNFAAGESEDFMVLNRRYVGESEPANGVIKDLTTYIDPSKHIEIFADTALDSQNFWVQTACEITRRGNYAAKQIPNL